MDMSKITRIMDEYFSTVTDEQFEKDLIAAGIENCPDKEVERAMIIEHTYDNRKICNGCSFLNLDADGWHGTCECQENRIKNRNRFVTDKKCTHKRLVPGFYATAEVSDG